MHRSDAPRPRQWSWRIGRLFGINIFVHATFALLLGWVALTHLAGGFGAVLRGLALVLAVFVIIVMHELAHALTARRFGIPTRDITLLAIGGVSRLEQSPERPRDELLIALAGPAVNIVLAALAWAILASTGRSALPGGVGVGSSFVAQLLWVNVTLAVFNLLPAFPMDGGRVLRALLALVMDDLAATRFAAHVGRFMALLFVVAGLAFNPFLIVIGVFVWLGAQQESVAAGFKRALAGAPIASAMLQEFRVLSPIDHLGLPAALAVAGAQHDFPVVDGTRLVGVLTRSDIARGLANGGPEAAVGALMHREPVTAQPNDPLTDIVASLQARDAAPVVVLRDGGVVGLVTADSLGGFVLLQGARHAHGAT